MTLSRTTTLIAVAMLAAPLGSAAGAPEMTHAYGYDFATITDVGNAPVPAELVPFQSSQIGRGSVDHAYRMATTELTTVQWVEFMDTFSRDHAQWVRDNLRPSIWAGGENHQWQGPGEDWVVSPDFERSIVGGISWRSAAMYCNWLHNGQSSDFESLMSGAYDASTFITNPDGSFQDQPTRSPDARFWIPSLDEHLKATHYDPNRFGDGQGGWWLYPYSSDTAPVSGWPDEPGAQTSADTSFRDGMNPAFYIQVGDYPLATTPWGLLDASGGAGEWIEEIVPNPTSDWAREALGSDISSHPVFDRLGRFGLGGGRPDGTVQDPFTGLRIAAAVPSQSTAAVISSMALIAARRRRRQ